MDSTPQIVMMAVTLALTVLGAGAMLWRTARRRAAEAVTPTDAPARQT